MGKHRARNIILITIAITILISALGWVTYRIMDYVMNDALNLFPVPEIVGLLIFFVIILVALIILGIKGNKLVKTILGRL